MSHRICDACNKQMQEGYVINGGEEYYCRKECLHKKHSPAEWDEMYDNNDSYWTDWYDEDEE